MEGTRTLKRTRLVRLLAACALCLGLAFAFAGCSGGGSEGASGGDAPKNDQAAESATRTFTDSAGREVEVPAQIDRIAPAGHTATQVLLTMAPDKLVTLSQELTADQAKYLGGDYADLPVTGAAFGAKGDLNKEAVAAAGAQILIDTGEAKDGIKEDLDTLQTQLGIPVVFVETTMDTYGDAYEMLGELLGMEDRGAELSAYCKNAYDETVSVMAGIPEDRARARGLPAGRRGHEHHREELLPGPGRRPCGEQRGRPGQGVGQRQRHRGEPRAGVPLGSRAHPVPGGQHIRHRGQRPGLGRPFGRQERQLLRGARRAVVLAQQPARP